ncbi:MAG: class I SAM-dependent methyltransferase [Spirochaetes bacterium]|nr:class I SAM-dependent methyltransferase [Spirochaetota bacterium]
MRFFQSRFYFFLRDLYIKFFQIPCVKNRIVKKFHKLYYYIPNKDAAKNDLSWHQTYWFGTAIQKNPMDLWIYHELLVEIKPDVIIECGTADGGSASFFASQLDLIGKGRIVSIDIAKNSKHPKHKRITYITGSSTDEKIVKQATSKIKKTDKVLVILDSDHSREHVFNELNIYSKYVSKKSYIVVEDSNLNGYPVMPHWGEGPMEAIKEFMKDNKKFEIDKTREKFYMTFNPNGYLKRLK